MSTREIPDGPPGEYRFLVTIMVDGYGRPRQLADEIRKVSERMYWNEFGECATVTLVRMTDDPGTEAKEISLLDDDTVGTADSTDNPVVEG